MEALLRSSIAPRPDTTEPSRGISGLEDLDTIFTDKETKYGLPPGTLKSLAQQESSMRPHIEGPVITNPKSSHYGHRAQGLFQFMPATWKGEGHVGDPFNPHDAAEAAAKKLSKAMKRRGSIEGALADYYGRGQPPEGHPTTEDYVKNVTRKHPTGDLQGSLQDVSEDKNVDERAQLQEASVRLNTPIDLLPKDAKRLQWLKEHSPEGMKMLHPKLSKWISESPLDPAQYIKPDEFDDLGYFESVAAELGKQGNPVSDLLVSTGPKALSTLYTSGVGIIGFLQGLYGEGGALGKYLNSVGVGPKDAERLADLMYSEPRRELKEEIEKIEGFAENLEAYGRNPDQVLHEVLTFVGPSKLAGTLGKKLLERLFGERLITDVAKRMGFIDKKFTGPIDLTKIQKRWKSLSDYDRALLGGALGEAGLTLGHLVEEMRAGTDDQLLTFKQWLAAPASAAITGMLAVAFGGLAKKLGADDFQTLLAGGKIDDVLRASNSPRNSKLMRMFNSFWINSFEEATQETQEQIMQNVASGRPWDEGIGKAAAAGFALGGGHGGMASTIGAITDMAGGARSRDAFQRDQVRKAAIIKAYRDQAVLGRLNELESQHELRERSPEVYNDMMRVMFDDPNMPGELFIDAKVLQAALEAEGVTTEELEQKLPGLAVQLQEAAAIESEIAIKPQDFLARFAGTPVGDKVINHIRTDERGMTYAEAKEDLKEFEKEMDERAKQLAEEQGPPLSREEFYQAQQSQVQPDTEQQEFQENVIKSVREEPGSNEPRIAELEKRIAELEAMDAKDRNEEELQDLKGELETYETPEVTAADQLKNARVPTGEVTDQAIDLPLTYEEYIKNYTVAASYQADLEQTKIGILEIMKATGRYTPETLAVNAAVIHNAIASLAARMRMLPSELLKEFPITFSSDGKSFTFGEPVSQGAEWDNFSKNNIKDILKKRNWAILSAELEGMTDEEKSKATAALEADLKARGFRYLKSKGHYGIPENSFVVIGIDDDTAHKFGNTYAQESVLTPTGFIFQNGAVQKPVSVTTFDSIEDAKKDGKGYTHIPELGTTFRVEFEKRIVQPGSLEGKGIHFSGEMRTSLRGEFAGTNKGIIGAERARLAESTDDRIKKRVDFYIDEGKGIRKETGLGSVKHVVNLSNIYDGSKDPLKLWKEYPDQKKAANDFESAIVNAGFDGYYMKQGDQGRVVILGDAAEDIAVDSAQEVLNQANKLRMGKQSLKKFGLQKPEGKQRVKVRDLASALEAQSRKLYGDKLKWKGKEYTQEQVAIAGKWMAQEVKFELKNPNKSGRGWYSEKYPNALNIMSEVFPELMDDVNARDMFTLFIAITSDQASPDINISLASDIYSNFRKDKKTIKVSDGRKVKSTSVKPALARMEKLLAEKGSIEALTEYLMHEDTVKNLKAEAKIDKIPGGADYGVDVILPRAVVLFGAKLGAFYANLMGKHKYLTMDRWWSRTINRYRGTLLTAPTKKGLKEFREMVGLPADLSDDETISEAVPWAEEAEELYTAGKGAGKKELRSPAHKKAQGILKAATGTQDTPMGVWDRKFMTEVAKEAQRLLNKNPLTRSTIADIQAILWYYEKKLYGELGARPSKLISFEEAARAFVNKREAVEQHPGEEMMEVVEESEAFNQMRGFYSGLERGFDTVQNNKQVSKKEGLDVNQLVVWLNKMATDPKFRHLGIRKSELVATGLLDWLKIQKEGNVSQVRDQKAIDAKEAEISEKMEAAKNKIGEAADILAKRMYEGAVDVIGPNSAMPLEWFKDQIMENPWSYREGLHTTGLFSPPHQGTLEQWLNAMDRSSYSPLNFDNINYTKLETIPARTHIPFSEVWEYIHNKGAIDIEERFLGMDRRESVEEYIRNQKAIRDIPYEIRKVEDADGEYYIVWSINHRMETGETYAYETEAMEAAETAWGNDLISEYHRLEDDGLEATGRPRWSDHRIPGEATNYREIVVAMVTPGRKVLFHPSGHWSGEVGENALFHLRVDDRVGPNGEKIMMVNEMQSDWATAGRWEFNEKGNVTKVGFKPTKEEIAKTVKQVGKLKSKRQELIDKRKDSFDQVEIDSLSEELMKVDVELTRAESILDVSTDDAAYIEKAPFIQNDDWVKLAMKKLLQHAVDGGYDQIAWSTGEQQVDMWTGAVRDQVDLIDWEKTKDGVHITGYKGTQQPPLELRLARERFSNMAESNKELYTQAAVAIGSDEDLRSIINNPENWQDRFEDLPAYTINTVNVYLSQRAALNEEEKNILKMEKEISESDRTGYTKVDRADTHVKETELTDVLGKAMADTVRNDPNQKGTLRGDTLTVTSPGFFSLYDRKAPSAMTKVVKELGVAGEAGEVPLRLESPRDIEEENRQLEEWHNAQHLQRVLGHRKHPEIDNHFVLTNDGQGTYYRSISVPSVRNLSDPVNWSFNIDQAVAYPIEAINHHINHVKEAAKKPEPQTGLVVEEGTTEIGPEWRVKDLATGLYYQEGALSASHSYADVFKTRELAQAIIDAPIGNMQPGINITQEIRDAVIGGQNLFTQPGPVDSSGYPADGPLATYSPNSFTISLLSGANLSSTLHEGGHFYLHILSEMARHPNAPQEIKDDFQKIVNWFGLDDVAQWYSMSIADQREYHEQWAESFELYFLEGKSPNEEMKPIFTRFREWLTKVYVSTEEFLKVNPRAGKLNDEVREVFSRLIASTEGIQQAENNAGYVPLYSSAEEAGMTEEKFREYLEEEKKATDEAITKLTARSIRDMKWSSNAKNKVIKKLQASAKKERDRITDEVRAELENKEINKARRFLLWGKITSDEGEEIEVEQGHKLNTQAIKDLGVNPLDLRGMTSPTGLDPQEVGEMFGYEHGGNFVQHLLDDPTIREELGPLVDQRMREEFSDISDETAMERAAEKAIHNDVRAKHIATGMKMLTESPMSVAQITKVAKQAGQRAVGKQKVRDLRPSRYERAENKANKEAIKLVAKDPVGAARAQQTALLNNQLAKAAHEAQEEIDKIVRKVKALGSKGTKANIDQEYVDQIDALLEPFDFRQVTLKNIDRMLSLSEWLKKQEEENGFQPIIDPDVAERLKAKNYKEMTVDELRELMNTIKQVEHLGRLKKKLLDSKDQRELEAILAEANEWIVANANRTVKEKGTDKSVTGRASGVFRGWLAEHRKFSSLVREMDGGKAGGLIWNLLSRGMNAAGDREAAMRADATTVLGKLFDSFKNKTAPLNLYPRRMNIPGTEIHMTQEERVMFGMNWGNLGNRQRLLDGGMAGHRAGFTEQDANAILDTLTKEEWDFIQDVLDYFETFKPATAQLEKELTGVEPEWIDPEPMVTKFGTYRGGYFPAKYDGQLSTRSQTLDAMNDVRMDMMAAKGNPTTRSSYAKKRADEVKNRPMLLNYDVIAAHVTEVTHRLAWQRWLLDANRILNGLSEPIIKHYGMENYTEMKTLLEEIAKGDNLGTKVSERLLNHLRIGSTIVGMGWRITTALLQPSGIFQSMSRIGVKWATVGIYQFLSHPARSLELVNNSVLMKHRASTMQREVSEVLNTVRSGKRMNVVKGSFFTLIAQMQRLVDVPTWLGAYEKSLAELQYENAVNEEQRKEIESRAMAMADQEVKDTQAGGQLHDLARVQRGSPAWKLFTNFYSYFSASYNLNVENYRRTNFKNPTEFGMFLVNTLLINMMPPLYATILRQLLKDECPEWELECLAKELAAEQISMLFGQMIILREFTPAAMHAVTGKGHYFDYSGTAGGRIFSMAEKTAEDYRRIYEGSKEIDTRTAALNLELLGFILHLPTGQLSTSLKGASSVQEGDTEPERTLPALLVGPTYRK